MPLHWIIDSRAKLVVAVADGVVTRPDVDELLTSLVGAGAVPYRKLLDGRFANVAMNPDELTEIAAKIRALHVQPVGPLAVVLPKEKSELLLRVLGALAAADRPMRIFKDLQLAHRWIDHLGLPSTPIGDAASQ